MYSNGAYTCAKLILSIWYKNTNLKFYAWYPKVIMLENKHKKTHIAVKWDS